MKRAHVAALVFGLATIVAICEDVRAEEVTDENGEVVEKPPEPPGTLKTLLAYGLVLGGLTIVLLPMPTALKGNLKYLHTRVMMINLLRSNPNHAENVCKTMPGSFMEAIGGAIKTAAMMRTRDPKVIVSATIPTYDALGSAVSMKWKTMIGKAKLGVMAAVGGMAMALATGVWPVFVIAIGLCAIGCFVYLLVRKSAVDSSIVQARAEVLPEVDRAFIDGRYALPPAP